MDPTLPEELRRAHGRAADELRPTRIEVNPLKFAEGSALIEVGDTRVLVAASVEKRVPPFLEGKETGWLTAEYSMLPRATSTRTTREVARGRPSGRTAEIQRLIGRSLRAAFDLGALPGRTLIVDCDVLQADGGTRTAAVTGGYVAATLAVGSLYLAGDLERWPSVMPVAAISVGLLGGRPILDLDAAEDQQAEVDMNLVAGRGQQLVEIQGTAEGRTFSRTELDTLLDVGFKGLDALSAVQGEALAELLEQVEEVRRRGERRPAAPRDEGDLWGAP